MVLSENKDRSAPLTCIDPFPAIPDSSARYVYSAEDWRKNTQYLHKVEMAKGYSPMNMKHITFAKPINLVVIDMNDVYESLEFWKRFVLVGGKFLVHTYNQGGVFPEVEDAVHNFLSKNGNYGLDNMHYSAILTRRN